MADLHEGRELQITADHYGLFKGKEWQKIFSPLSSNQLLEVSLQIKSADMAGLDGPERPLQGVDSNSDSLALPQMLHVLQMASEPTCLQAIRTLHQSPVPLHSLILGVPFAFLREGLMLLEMA